MATVEQRVSFIEGKLGALATKEDVANIKLDMLRWLVLVQFAGLSAVAAIMRFVD